MIINDLDGYYIVFDTKNWNTELDTLVIKDIDLWFNNRLSVNLKVPVAEKILISKAKVNEFKEWFTGN